MNRAGITPQPQLATAYTEGAEVPGIPPAGMSRPPVFAACATPTSYYTQPFPPMTPDLAILTSGV